RSAVNPVQEAKTNHTHPCIYHRHGLQKRIEFINRLLRLFHGSSRWQSDIGHNHSAVLIRDESGRSNAEQPNCKCRKSNQNRGCNPFSLTKYTQRFDVARGHPVKVGVECDEKTLFETRFMVFAVLMRLEEQGT